MAKHPACWFAQWSDKPCYVDWLGIMACHLFPKQELKRWGITDERVWDLRLVRAGCSGHHHSFDAGFLLVPRSAIGPETPEFIAELGRSVGAGGRFSERWENDPRLLT